MSRAVLLCVLLSLMPAGAQIAPIPPGTKAPPEARLHPLNWDWRREEELSWKQSIERTRTLSTSERNRLLAAISEEFSTSEFEFESEDDRQKAPAQARIKYVVLGSDGRSEVIVQAGDSTTCGPTGNCAFWIFRKRGKSYSPILRAEAQTFTVQPSRTRGFLEIVLTRHGSAFESEVKVYRFSGEIYREGECYTAEWEQLNSNGEFHKLKEPRLTACGAR